MKSLCRCRWRWPIFEWCVRMLVCLGWGFWVCAVLLLRCYYVGCYVLCSVRLGIRFVVSCMSSVCCTSIWLLRTGICVVRGGWRCTVRWCLWTWVSCIWLFSSLWVFCVLISPGSLVCSLLLFQLWTEILGVGRFSRSGSSVCQSGLGQILSECRPRICSSLWSCVSLSEV